MWSSGVFELKIQSFVSGARGACGHSRAPLSLRDCQIFFRVCLKHAQDVIDPEPPCTYGTALTGIFAADSNSVSESAPIRVPFHFKWPVSTTIMARYSSSSALVPRIKCTS